MKPRRPDFMTLSFRRAKPLALLVMLAIAAGAFVAFAQDAAAPQAAPKTNQSPANQSVKLELPVTGVHNLHLEHQPDGEYRYIITRDDGSRTAYTPQQFTVILFDDQVNRPWWQVLLNITSPLGIIWVVVGLLAQVLFSGRMILQWLVSEKEHRSVVPTGFWWMSMAGASMLMAYFIWRKDIVGFLGQATGWMIYLRNLYLIYTSPGDPPGLTENATE